MQVDVLLLLIHLVKCGLRPSMFAGNFSDLFADRCEYIWALICVECWWIWWWLIDGELPLNRTTRQNLLFYGMLWWYDFSNNLYLIHSVYESSILLGEMLLQLLNTLAQWLLCLHLADCCFWVTACLASRKLFVGCKQCLKPDSPMNYYLNHCRVKFERWAVPHWLAFLHWSKVNLTASFPKFTTVCQQHK